jgi:hypothetical protein
MQNLENHRTHCCWFLFCFWFYLPFLLGNCKRGYTWLLDSVTFHLCEDRVFKVSKFAPFFFYLGSWCRKNRVFFPLKRDELWIFFFMRKKNAGFIKMDDKKNKIKNDCDVRTNNGYVI